jgi:hypothetical protein
MILVSMPGLVRGLLFALLACSLLVNPAAPPAAFYEDDEAPLEEIDDESAATDPAAPASTEAAGIERPPADSEGA